jgi:AMMECR1 domain-containing protein
MTRKNKAPDAIETARAAIKMKLEPSARKQAPADLRQRRRLDDAIFSTWPHHR